MNKYAGILIINCDTKSQMVNLTGTDEILPVVKQDIDDFMKKRTIFTQVVCYQPNRQKFIVTVWSSRLQSICEKLKEEVVQITPINANTELELKGTSRGLAETKEELEKLGKQICMHKETYTMPAMLKFFRRSDCSEGLELIGSSNKCVLALQSEPHGLHVKSAGCRTSANGSQQNPQKHMNTRTTPAKSVFLLSTALKSCGQHTGASGPSLTSGAKAKSFGIIKTSVVEGEIALQMADVIVNTTDSGMNLSIGAVSSSILAKAGQALQHECKTKYPGGVMVGDVACTQGHGLQCKAVYHVALPHWFSANSKQNLSEVVTKCLTKASNTGYTSLVFPALGTGNLEYPRDESARTMLEAIDGFQRANPWTSVRDVGIVVYQKDIQTVQIFHQVHKQQASALAACTDFFGIGPSLSSGAVASPSGVINTCVVEGDIALQNADVIVNTTTTYMDFKSCPVSSSILAKAGQALQDDCRTKNPEGLKVGHITCTKGYGLRCKVVYHLTLPCWSSANSKQNLSKVVTKCLTMASNKGYTSLVFPALGTGKLVYPRDVSARIMLEAIDEFQRANPLTSVRDVRIVIYQKDRQTFQEFQRVHSAYGQAYGMHRQPAVHLEQLTGNRQARRISKRTQYTPAPLAGIGPATQESGTSTPLLVSPLPPSTDLFVYAESQESIPHVLEALQDSVLKKFHEVILEQSALKDMEQSVIKRICDAGQSHDVEVTVQQADGKIRLHGHKVAVLQAQNDIKDIISAAVQQRQKEEAEEMIARMVQWSYIEVTYTGRTCTEYEKPQNKIIEEAFQKKQKVARLVDNSGTVYIVNFDLMREYLENETDDFVYVIRRDKTGLDIARSELPITWLPHTADENLQIVSLKPSDAEYMEVEQNFRRTLNADLSALPTQNIKRIDATIVAIDRIQNQLLMKYYLAKKAHMDQHNPSGTQNERTLWHGTRSAATASINQDGFNRSYCGENATAFGEGVYFAVNSSYSAQPIYSAADGHSGYSYIYQCKVLTGRTTKGYHKMRVLPQNTAGQTVFDSATDNVHKPSMYVIFSDTQAYPEYLITFKRRIRSWPGVGSDTNGY